jgi:hypothetical protein
MLVSDQLVTGADWPLKVTVPVPCCAPKPLPEIVTQAPGAPLVADKLLMDGAANAGKLDRSRTASNRMFRQCKSILQLFLAFAIGTWRLAQRRLLCDTKLTANG